MGLNARKPDFVSWELQRGRPACQFMRSQCFCNSLSRNYYTETCYRQNSIS